MLTECRLAWQITLSTLHGPAAAPGFSAGLAWTGPRKAHRRWLEVNTTWEILIPTCYLDAGLARTTAGKEVSGALKEAVGGRLSVPHSAKRFPGLIQKAGNATQKLIRTHHGSERGRLYGLSNEVDEEPYRKQSSQFIKNVTPDPVEERYEKAHPLYERIQSARKKWNPRAETASCPEERSGSSKEGEFLRAQERTAESQYTEPQFSRKIFQLKTTINLLTKQQRNKQTNK